MSSTPTETQPPQLQNIQAIYDREPHVAQNSTTTASTYLSIQLQLVMRLLQHKNQKYFNHTGVQRCWFIISAEEVYINLMQNQEYLKQRHPRSYDFTTMYTMLKHEQIIHNVREAIREAKKYIKEGLTPAEADTYDKILDPEKKLMEHVKFIVKNTYLCTNKGALRHQVIGIPMGTNSAPELANLTLYYDEAKFIDDFTTPKDGKSVNAQAGEQKAKQHCFNFRLIDDILTWNEEPPSPKIYGLEWLETTEKD